MGYQKILFLKSIFTLVIFFIGFAGFSKQFVLGRVLDEKNNPIVEANVFIGGTYDGASSGADGSF